MGRYDFSNKRRGIHDCGIIKGIQGYTTEACIDNRILGGGLGIKHTDIIRPGLTFYISGDIRP
jgi:hypothetical protein